ncbi:MAG: RtcB family protein [Candidatus Micrarchaeota archaeon]
MGFNEIKPGIFESPKEGAMRVPVRAVATKEMLDKMMTDRTLGQAKNVASLPGILEAAYVMPDGHEGYGFPIGGVAAFDPEEGIVSPGGVGYDINCLAEGTKIVHSLGFAIPIEKFETFFTNFEQSGKYEISLSVQRTFVSSVDPKSKNLVPRALLAFMKKKADNRIFEISTRTGLKLRCSQDHPLLTGYGMKKAGELAVGDKVGINLFEGCGYSAIENPYETGILAKILGYLIGDGTLTYSGKKGRVVAYGVNDDLTVMQADLESIGVKSSIFFRKRRSCIKSQYGTREFMGQASELHIYSQDFAGKMEKLGLPRGKKASAKFGVPEWIRKSPLWIKRLFLAGLFGAELTTPATHSKTGFNSPILAQNKNEYAKDSGRLFLSEIMSLLDELGIKCTKLAEREEYPNKQGKTFRLRLEISADESNLLRLFRQVGFEYNQKRSKMAQIAVKYILLKKIEFQGRLEISEKTREFKTKGLSLKEVQKLLDSPIANKRFIERSYYENLPVRISQAFESFAEFCHKAQNELNQLGCLLDEIVEIAEINYDGLVYDFTVAETHNFIANGLVVSNCGVRLIRTNLNENDIRPKLKQLINKLYENVPSGVGSKSKVRLNPQELEKAVSEGLKWSMDQGYATQKDIEHCEENGHFAESDYSKVSDMAKKRGGPQLGTLGAGNHFVEIQKVEKIYDEEIAKSFGILNENQITIMVHSGSRGYGHQICDDFIRTMMGAIQRNNWQLPDRELSYAPLAAKEAQDYLGAMRTAINFAFNNRQLMTHWTRETFQQVLGGKWEDYDLSLVYDVCHNIAKFEEHEVQGQTKKVCVHRKGATRAFWKGRKEVPQAYRNVGQPVIIPGSMNTASYLLCGLPGAAVSFGSSCHGAGRVMSRHEATRKFSGREIVKQMESKGQEIQAGSYDLLAEEFGGAYKNVDEVVKAVELAGISKIVARMVPIGVIKG